jgi:F-type H+-transporting ATPase subunit delta
MADVQAGKRYAQAAFELALRTGDLARWRSDLDDVASVLAESGAAPILGDARVALDRRLAMVERMLDIQPLAVNLAKLLVAKGRAADARAVADAFNRIADEHEGIAHASITTAVPLAADQLAEMETRLGTALGKRVLATASVDPGILGGVVVRIGDRLVDGSVKTRLRRLRLNLEGAR